MKIPDLLLAVGESILLVFLMFQYTEPLFPPLSHFLAKITDEERYKVEKMVNTD